MEYVLGRHLAVTGSPPTPTKLPSTQQVLTKHSSFIFLIYVISSAGQLAHLLPFHICPPKRRKRGPRSVPQLVQCPS